MLLKSHNSNFVYFCKVIESFVNHSKKLDLSQKTNFIFNFFFN